MSTLELLPISVRLGKMGHTHIRLVASEDVLTGALRGNCELIRTQRQAERTPMWGSRVTEKNTGSDDDESNKSAEH
jgi:hypothetical protein